VIRDNFSFSKFPQNNHDDPVHADKKGNQMVFQFADEGNEG
jgi:hypothetical protein